MNAHNLLEIIGESPEEYLEDAKHPHKQKTPAWVKWGSAVAACLILAISVVTVTQFFRHGNMAQDNASMAGDTAEKGTIPEDGAGQSGVTGDSESSTDTEMAIERGNIAIYYVTESGLKTETIELEFTATTVFEAWKEANGIGADVQLISCHIEDNSSMTTHGTGEDAVVEHKLGDYFILNITVSKTLENYYDAVDPVLLLESLEKTMTGYSDIEYDEYHLTLE